MNAPVTIEPLNDANGAEWDSFVRTCNDASFFHLTGWIAAIKEVYGHRPHCLLARSNGRVVGVLPLVHMRSILFGNALISSPFCVYGGVAATDPEAAERLSKEAKALGCDLGVSYVELRQRAALLTDLPTRSNLYATFRRAIGPDQDAMLKAIPRKKRADVRKGLQGRLRVEITDDISVFFRIYANSVHRLGTPVLPSRFFSSLLKQFAGSAEVSVVHGPNGPVAALISFFFRDEVLPYYGGALEEARDLHAYDYLYWTLMCRAAERGFRVFDFGRSKRGTGAFAYKTYWGFEPEPLHYQYHLIRQSHLPDMNPLSPKFRGLVALWKRIPLGVASAIGPSIARHLG